MPFRGPERRLRARFRVRLPFVLRSDGQQIRGATRNVSLLGISAYGEGPLNQVQAVQCVLELPAGNNPVVANGTVIRCRPLQEAHPDGSYELGVFFKEFQQQGETALSKFLDRVSLDEREAIQEGYRALKQRLADRKRRKRLKERRKQLRRQRRLRKRRILRRKQLAKKRQRKTS
ncbi:MAG: PilZ domain-containing protein [Candidatus Omnitrophica bacterium]|nr:PilZ domain-containing protein [Candidatus Omnitrophota bacterium]